jgi:hypothetical protein
VSRVQRTIAAATTDAVAAAGSRDAAALTDTVVRLSTVDPARLAVVLGWVVRSLLEERYPDGLDGEDLRAVLTGCATAAGTWESEVDPAVLLVVLTGALGLSDPDEQPAVPPPAVARNAVLLIAFLLRGRPVRPYLDASFAELQRAETIEMP